MAKNRYEQIRVNDLKVDYSYQRPIDQTRLNRIIKNYDPLQVRSLVLSRRSNGDLYIIDGQHTVAAILAVEGQKAFATAQVYCDLTVAEEAALFAKLNTNAKKPDSRDIIKAKYQAGDPEAVNYIDVVLKVSGINWLWKAGGKSKAWDAHDRCLKSIKAFGNEIVIKAFLVMKNFDDPKMYGANVLDGLCCIFQSKPDVQVSRLISVLNGVDPYKLKKAAEVYGGLSNDFSKKKAFCYGKAIVDLYNKGLRSNKISLKLTENVGGIEICA